LGALVALAACREKKKPQDDPNLIVFVNREPILRGDFQRELDQEVQAAGIDAQGAEQLEPFKQAVLRDLIDRRLLLQAAKAAGVTVSAEEIDRGVLRMGADYPTDSLNQALAEGQQSMAELRQHTAEQLTIEKLFQEHLYPRVAVTEAEIRKYFDEHPDEFKDPEEVHAAQIVVKTYDEAKRIQQQLQSGKFSDLARKYSLSPDAKVGGDLGFFHRGVMPHQFDDVAFKLGVGQVSDIVETEYGFHLFKVLEKRSARKHQLAEVHSKIHEKLLMEKRREAQVEYLKSLRAKANVQVNEQSLKLVVAKIPPPSSQKVEP
jgi:peptidyl-prolyl cis-trans isomerase C/foldase protein PrsA